MADKEKKEWKSMNETLAGVSGNKPPGKSDTKSKKEKQILGFYADQPSYRNEQIMKDLEDTVNKPPKSIGERIERR
jgi:hypothetical protein